MNDNSIAIDYRIITEDFHTPVHLVSPPPSSFRQNMNISKIVGQQ